MKDVDTLRGLHGVKTLGSAKKRSISRGQSSPYLELYVMEKEWERLVKESKRLEIRHKQVKQRLKEIDEYRDAAHRDTAKKASALMGEKEEACSKTKTWKKVSLKY